MTSAEWQERARAMLLARAFSEEQRRLLTNARIEDADSALLAMQRDLTNLTPQEFSDRISAIVERTARPLHDLALPAAGWYDDGLGNNRWWDSQQWTQHVWMAELNVKMPANASPSAAAGWYDDGSGSQRWWNGQNWV